MSKILIESAISAFVISVLAAPFIVYFSKRNGFFAVSNHRSSHVNQVPNTGGIILSFAIIVPLLIFSKYTQKEDFNMVASAFAVLLITGVIDDFNPIPVFYKFLGQFIPAIVIVSSLNEKELMIPFINNLDIPNIFNYLFWIIFIVVIINAYNLIDGIDGLASGLGIIGACFFGYIFVQNNESDLAVITFVLAGGLFGLMLFNFSKKWKIFIGDTGSLLIGGLMGYFALKYLGYSSHENFNRHFTEILGAFFLPLADLLRVIVERVRHGYSPFHADKKHIHHLLLMKFNNNHFISTAILLAIQLLLIFLFFLFTEKIDQGFFWFLIAVFICFLLFVRIIRPRT